MNCHTQTDDLSIAEGLTPEELSLVGDVFAAIQTAEHAAFADRGIAFDRQPRLILRAEIVSLAGSIAATASVMGGDGLAMLAMTIEMLRHATVAMLDAPPEAQAAAK